MTLGLRLDDPRLLVLRDGEHLSYLPLHDHTLDDLRAWVGRSAAVGGSGPVQLRDYAMPDHPFATGRPFDDRRADRFTALDAWTAIGFETLPPAAAGATHTEPRLWPHHFDIGSILPLVDDPAELPSIGIGLSLGDASDDRPYFYVNPYPRGDPPADRPAAPAGMAWADDWFGMVLPGEADRDVEAIVPTLREAIAVATRLVRPAT